MRYFSFVFIVVLIVGAVLTYRAFYVPTTFEGEKVVVIESGDGAREISEKLAGLGIIRSAWWFEMLVYVRGIGSDLKAGEYTFKSSSLSAVAFQLLHGEQRDQMHLTFIEGWTRAQMADLVGEKTEISRDDFLTATGSEALETLRGQYSFLESIPRGHTLEGFLFPDTYTFFVDARAEDIVRKMLDTFDERFTYDLRESINTTEYSLFDVVTMASVIEKEVRTVDDMKTVSGIFWKRLESGIPLQADSTVNYVIDGDNTSLTLEQTKLNTPYNTYLYPGLPKGPISNPGFNALTSSVHPEDNPYWYFLSKSSGETVFSKTLQEHNTAKNKYLK